MNDSKIEKILNSILSIAKGDLETQIEITGHEEELDAIALGLNMLGEELHHSQKTILDRENKILKSEQRFKRLVENISDGVVVVDLLGNIKESGTIIKTGISYEAKVVFTIKSFLQSILFNLISNSIKYKSRIRKPEIIVSVKKVEHEIFISVADNGIGIDLIKHREYVFGLYKRFHPEVEGRGLGIHMTKTQVEALGGKISIESKPDKGTTFTFSIPAEDYPHPIDVYRQEGKKGMLAPVNPLLVFTTNYSNSSQAR